MLSEVKRRASRIGFHKVKFITSIHITELILPVENPIPNETILSICFEKGGKISTSKDICYDLEKNALNLVEKDKDSNITSMVFNLNEYVELITTLYRDPTSGMYQDKQGKVILRQLENYNGLIGHGNYFKGIGVYTINLSEIAQCMGHEKYMTKDIKMPMIQLEGCYITGLISNTIIFAESNNMDENASIHSLASDCSYSSTIGASFYYEDVENYICEDSIADYQSITPSTNRTNNTPRTHSDYKKFGTGMHLAEIAVGKYERKNIMSPLNHRRPSNNASFPTNKYNIQEEHLNDSTATQHSSLSKSNIFSNIDDDDNNNNNNICDMENKNNSNNIAIAMLISEESVKITNKATCEMDIPKVSMEDKSTSTYEDFEFVEFNRRSISKSNNNSLKNTPIRSTEQTMSNKVIDGMKSVIIDYTPTVTNNIDKNSIENIDNNIDNNINNNSPTNETITTYGNNGFYSDAFIVIEKELIARNLRIDELENQLYTRDNNYQKEIIDLQTKLNTIEILNENKHNLDNSKYNNSNNNKIEDNKNLYNNEVKNIDINLLNDYGKLLTQSKIMEQDIIYYKQLAINMVKAKTEETLACRESATAAVIACLKRAEVEQELNDIKEHVEEINLKYFELNNELLNEKQRNITLRNRIQKYAKELGKIEVSYVLSRNNTLDERNSKLSQKIK